MRWALILLLAGCATQETPHAVVECPAVTLAPRAPAAPRTWEQVAEWAMALGAVDRKNQAALAECRRVVEQMQERSR